MGREGGGEEVRGQSHHRGLLVPPSARTLASTLKERGRGCNQRRQEGTCTHGQEGTISCLGIRGCWGDSYVISQLTMKEGCSMKTEGDSWRNAGQSPSDLGVGPIETQRPSVCQAS